MRIKITISYDGTNYYGFQLQRELNTIEKELMRVLFKIHQRVIKVTGSGRTDRFVHAMGQVVHFDTTIKMSSDSWIRALNSNLSLDIRVIKCEQVSDDFHARFSAIKKEYRYFIQTKYDLFKRNYAEYFNKLDLELICIALDKIVGKHDFRGFCSKEVSMQKNTTKTIFEARMIQNGDTLEFIFIGDGFLKYQIRRMMGIIISIGLHQLDLSIMDKLFITLNPEICGKTLSGHGLYLWNVEYES